MTSAEAQVGRAGVELLGQLQSLPQHGGKPKRVGMLGIVSA